MLVAPSSGLEESTTALFACQEAIFTFSKKSADVFTSARDTKPPLLRGSLQLHCGVVCVSPPALKLLGLSGSAGRDRVRHCTGDYMQDRFRFKLLLP